MAKGKTANPADAFRKQQRLKEKKKNQEERRKVRETQTVKKDTRDLEREIRQLKESKQDASTKSRLAELEKEFEYVKKVKEKYVSEHPEHRHLVYRSEGKGKRIGGPGAGQDGDEDDDENKGSLSGPSHLYDSEGKLRDPTRSVYYHEVYNPFGVPPPGMPYMEKPLESDDESSEDDSDEDDEDEIVMPEGPAPGVKEEEDDDSDDSDDIPLPDGPPPTVGLPVQPSLPPGPPPDIGWGAHYQPGAPPPFRPPFPNLPFHPANQNGQNNFRPPIPIRPPMNFNGQPGSPYSHSQQSQGHYRPPNNYRPPNRLPTTVQDPLSDQPTQTYQGHRMMKHDLPARPPPIQSTSNPETSTSTPAKPPPTPVAAEISAAPQLRDLRKEATVFAPRAVGKRKRVGGTGGIGVGGIGGGINATPGAGEIDEDGDEVRKRVQEGPGLLGKLQGLLGNRQGRGGTGGKDEDDYQKFLEGLGDIA